MMMSLWKERIHKCVGLPVGVEADYERPNLVIINRPLQHGRGFINAQEVAHRLEVRWAGGAVGMAMARAGTELGRANDRAPAARSAAAATPQLPSLGLICGAAAGVAFWQEAPGCPATTTYPSPQEPCGLLVAAFAGARASSTHAATPGRRLLCQRRPNTRT